jgi:hypothetical protein
MSIAKASIFPHAIVCPQYITWQFDDGGKVGFGDLVVGWIVLEGNQSHKLGFGIGFRNQRNGHIQKTGLGIIPMIQILLKQQFNLLVWRVSHFGGLGEDVAALRNAMETTVVAGGVNAKSASLSGSDGTDVGLSK